MGGKIRTKWEANVGQRERMGRGRAGSNFGKENKVGGRRVREAQRERMGRKQVGVKVALQERCDLRQCYGRRTRGSTKKEVEGGPTLDRRKVNGENVGGSES
jgi:hypothetical protein